MKKVNLTKKTVTGLKARTKNSDEMNPETQKIAPLWGRFFHEVLPTLEEGSTVYAVYSNYESDANCEYDITVGADKIVKTQEMKKVVLDEGNYLCFKVKGELPQAIIKTWGEIWNYFEVKDCKEKREYKTDFELYLSQNEVEIYIGVE